MRIHIDFNATAALNTLTMTNGNASQIALFSGGGIFNGGVLTVTGCTITGNQAPTKTI